MSSPAFTQPERRSYALPILLALIAIAAAIGLARIYFPATSIDTEHIHTDLLPTKTAFKSESIVVGGHAEETLFVASTINVKNGRRVPIFLDNFSVTLTDNEGAELTAKALTKTELADVETNFPRLTPLATNPLLRDTQIDPGKSAQGTLVFSFPIPQKIWDDRKTATIKVDVYHEPPLFQEIPKARP